MKTLKYLIIGLVMTISGTVFGAEEMDQKCEAAIRSAHAATTKEELDAAEAAGVLHCPLVVDQTPMPGSSSTRATFLLGSILKNKDAGEELIDVCASKGITSSMGAVIKLRKLVREIPLLCDLLMTGVSSSVEEDTLNSLPQLQRKCKKVVTLFDSPLSCKKTREESEVSNFVVLANAGLTQAYRAINAYGARVEYGVETTDMYKRRIKYTLTMCKAIDEAHCAQYQNLDEQLADVLAKFSRDLVKMVREYVVTKEELAEAAKLKPLLAGEQARPYLEELASEARS